MRTQLIATMVAFLLCAPALTSAQAAAEGKVVSTGFTPTLAGTWKSATDEMRLTTAFDESVWGKDAKSTRIVELSVKPSGEGVLKVSRNVVDAKGRTVKGSTSVEEADIAVRENVMPTISSVAAISKLSGFEMIAFSRATSSSRICRRSSRR